MKISEVVAALTEARSEPYPIEATGPGVWRFNTDSGVITVTVDRATSDNLRVIHPAFSGSLGYSADGTAGSSANKIIWTVVTLIEELSQHEDIVVFVPVDSNERSLVKKTNLYGNLLARLRREGAIHRVGNFMVNSTKVFWAMPADSDAVRLSAAEIQSVIEKTVEEKLQNT